MVSSVAARRPALAMVVIGVGKHHGGMRDVGGLWQQ
jgi:hypothetical protein